MPSEYGYDGGGSVVGGLGQLLSMYNEQEKQNQQKAAVPFLNSALASYLHGNTLPNFQALAPFVSASQGLSEAGANTARAGDLNAEANRTTQMLPGQLQEQSLNNQYNQETMPQREYNLQQEGFKTAADTGMINSETANNQEKQPYIGPSMMGGILKDAADTAETNARSGLYNAQSAGLPQSQKDEHDKLMFDMNPDSPDNLLRKAQAGEATSRGNELQSEATMYGPQAGQGQPQAPTAEGKALLDYVTQHQAKTGQGGQSPTGQPQPPQYQDERPSIAPNILGLINPNLDPNTQAANEQQQLGAAKEHSALNDQVRQSGNAPTLNPTTVPQSSQVANLIGARVQQLAQLQQRMQRASQHPDQFKSQDLAQMQQQYAAITRYLQGQQ